MMKIIFTFALFIICTLGIVAQETVFHQEITWSPDGKFLSFSVYRKSNPSDKLLKREIFIMKADGSDARKVADDAAWTSWSKDGKRLLFSRANLEKKTSDIFSVKSDGSDLIQLTKDAKQNSHPAFSPDGKKIAFTSTRDSEKNQIYIMNSDGTNIRRLTTDSAVGFFNPMWSTNSRKIVFYSDKGDQKDQVWTINADGTDQILLTNNIGHNTYPSWSPDGKRIIFNSTRDSEQKIYTMNSNGATLQSLANIKNCFLARYSPNGKKIALLVGGFPSNDIYIADADGSNQRKITNK